jgi:hypothetical protein
MSTPAPGTPPASGSKKKSTSTSLPDVTTAIYALLQPLTSEERGKVIHAALTLLGDVPADGPSHGGNGSGQPQPGGGGTPDSRERFHGISKEGQTWMTRSGLTRDRIDQFFHIGNGTVTVIQSPFSNDNKRRQSVTAYLLTGVARLLATGTSAFTDDEARGVCRDFGSFDSGNHTRVMEALKGRITGSKDAGWRLTVPGLTEAANLLRASQEG